MSAPIMRLLNTRNFKINEFSSDPIPPYAILSHRWDKEGEVTFKDMEGTGIAIKKGYEKVKNFCSVARADGFEYVWMDNCCIDKTSSAELSEAINSMYRWYQRAEVCYAYLADVPFDIFNCLAGFIGSEFSRSEWFTRGWTLQELIAPSRLIFLSQEWREIGTKSSLQEDIFRITGIPIPILSGDHNLETASIAQRMSWAAKRKTSRLEDRAYSLMGMFGINIPLIYGEGETAFVRLQEEIIKVSDDHSIFAWKSKNQNNGGLLATSPDAFEESADIILRHSPSITTNSPWTVSNKGINLELSFIGIGYRGLGLAILPCTKLGKEDLLLGIFLRDVSLTMEQLRRVWCGNLELVNLRRFRQQQYPIRQICVRQRLLATTKIPEDHQEYRPNSIRTKEYGFSPEVARRDLNSELFDERPTNFADVTEPMSLVLTPQTRSDDLADKNLWTLLSHAVGGGRVEEVRLLLARMIIPADSKDGNGRTLLSHAARVGHATVVWLLLAQCNAMADSKDEDERTPLSYAAEGGHKDIVWLLLARSDIKSDIGDISGRTPLSYAAQSGHEAVVKMLLKESTNIESKNTNNGRTPLSYAAERGHEAVVRLLLDKSADVELKDKEGLTPLLRAAQDGNEAIVRLLLDKGAEIELKDNYGLTPLWWASRNGHEAIVRLLLETGKAETDTKDKDGQTPLWWATRNGHETIVQLLLEIGKADADTKDNYGRTPLWWAARYGHEAIVQLLLDTSKVDADTKDEDSRTPLWWASRNGHETIVQLLLEIGKVDTDTKDIYGRTPLCQAAQSGNEAIVRLLLDTGKVDADTKDKDGQTPLWWATRNGHETIVQLLLEIGKVDADTKDNYGRTPLWWASRNRHEAVVKLLRKHIN